VDQRKLVDMPTSRLEAFSDGVIAILITIMILELPAPEGHHLEALRPGIPVLIAYILSFVILGIYWNNHHHLFSATHEVTAGVLWSNHHLLFWLSLIPFVTGWMGESGFAPVPTAVYGVVLFSSGVAYLILQTVIIRHEGLDSPLGRAIGRDLKGKLTAFLYAAAIPLAFVHPWISGVLYTTVALMWLLPDRRIEPVIQAEAKEIAANANQVSEP